MSRLLERAVFAVISFGLSIEKRLKQRSVRRHLAGMARETEPRLPDVRWPNPATRSFLYRRAR